VLNKEIDCSQNRDVAQAIGKKYIIENCVTSSYVIGNLRVETSKY